MLPVSITRDDGRKFKLYLAKERGDFSDDTRWFCEYREDKTEYELEVQRCADSESDARAATLIYLLENELYRV
jgi:hypothetical protein